MGAWLQVSLDYARLHNQDAQQFPMVRVKALFTRLSIILSR
jgi:hypothetical protein